MTVRGVLTRLGGSSALRFSAWLAGGLLLCASPNAAQATCRDVRTLLQQGFAVDDIAAAMGVSPDQIVACTRGGSMRSRRTSRAVGPAPLGAAGPAPLGAAGPAPLGAAGPAPLGAAGPAPLGAAGPAPGH